MSEELFAGPRQGEEYPWYFRKGLTTHPASAPAPPPPCPRPLPRPAPPCPLPPPKEKVFVKETAE